MREGEVFSQDLLLLKWGFVDLLPVHSKESENDSAAMFILFFPGCQFGGYLG